ncbi:MAG TPA: amidohydrolase family protein [Chthonomonadaceae bacterium]|nr:amidohydrolase family protein [Chthonomonadaceae bacterium]
MSQLFERAADARTPDSLSAETGRGPLVRCGDARGFQTASAVGICGESGRRERRPGAAARTSQPARRLARSAPGLCRALLGAAIGCAMAATASAQPPAQPAAAAAKKPAIVELEKDRVPSLVTHGSCLIKNGTVITVTHGVIPNGDVLITDGKIAAVGKGLQAPAGIATIDATGRFVTPGIVDAHSHISADAVNEGTDSITAEVRIEDVLNPESISIWRGLSNGVTTSLVLHGSANAIGGQSSVIKMKFKRNVEDLLVPDAPRMIKFALGENVKRSGRGGQGPSRYPTTRMGVESVYRRAFAQARAYMQEWDRYEADVRAGKAVAAPRRDLRLETLADVLRRKIWVQCHCYRTDEMLMMVRLSQEFGFKIGALQHALEAYRIAPELAAAHIPVSTFADAWAYKVEAFEAVPYNAAMCLRAGILTSVNSDNSAGAYRLNLEAAKAIKFGGLTENEAWRLITINPAEQLGVEKRTGSLDTGKDGDVAIWEGNPFTTSSKCVATLVEGDLFFTRRDAFGVDKSAVVRDNYPNCPIDHLALKPPAAAHAYAIVDATVHPISGPEIMHGTVLIENDKITGVGAHLAVPRGAVVVRATGLHVYPGMIDAGSSLGLDEIGQVPATADNSESGTFLPDLRAVTAVNAASEHIAITRADGITTALTRPDTGGGGGFRGGGTLISGQGGVILLDGWTPEQMALRSPATLHVAFPETRTGGRGGRAAAALAGRGNRVEQEQIRRLREYFERAQRYAAARTESSATPIDPQLEAMRPYVSGSLPVVFVATTATGIKHALEFAVQLKLKPVIESGAEALKVADQLAAAKCGVIYRLPMQNSIDSSAPPHEYDPYDSVFAAPGILARAGVPVCFASNDAAMAKNLPTQVGITRGFGLSDAAAMRAMTMDAATILCVADRVGSLETGKLANIIITDGDPLEITTHLHAMFVAGKAVPLENKHTRMYQKYLQRLPAGAPTPGVHSAAHGQPAATQTGVLY